MTAKIIIIGAGASGLAAAIAAGRIFKETGAEEDNPVILLERMSSAGKKILATGNGRCNFTNKNMSPVCFHSDTQAPFSKVLEQFTQSDTEDFFRELGIVIKERDGYLYPMSGQASSMLDVLLMEIRQLPVKLITQCEIKDIRRTKRGFSLEDLDGRRYSASRIIVAAGGRACPSLGSNGSGYALAKSLGHRIVPPVPALTGLYSTQKYFKQVAGVRVDGQITLYSINNGEHLPMVQDRGELQLTDYGISGIPAFQISRFASRSLQKGIAVEASLDFMPDMDNGRLFMFLLQRAQVRPDKKTDEFLTGMFNQKLCALLIRLSQIDPEKPAKGLTKKELHRLVTFIKDLRTPISKTGDFDRAQVCAGGVDGSQINIHMESKIVPGLYFTGELVDVDGICGGYNLQWAWSSGYVAGYNAALSCSDSSRSSIRHPV